MVAPVSVTHRRVLARNRLLERRQFPGIGDPLTAGLLPPFLDPLSTDVHPPKATPPIVPTPAIPVNLPTSATSTTLTLASSSVSTSATLALVSSSASTSATLAPVISSASISATLAPVNNSASTSTVAPSTLNTALASSSQTASASPASSHGNVVGGTIAGVVLLVALVVMGAFVLRQRRRRRARNALIPTVEPFIVNPPEKELPLPPMAEQRMTFGTQYGRPGPAYDGRNRTTYSDEPFSNDPTVPQSPFADAVVAPGSRNLTSFIHFERESPKHFDNSSFSYSQYPEAPRSPFADPVVEGLRSPPAVALRHIPSLTASGGDGGAALGYSPVTRSDFGAQNHPHIVGRPVTVYDESDAYGGI